MSEINIENRLGKDFYTLSAIKAAPLLVGKALVRVNDGVKEKFRITETECYLGEEDTACHAHKGKTERNSVMYKEGGVAYVYLCYGIHYLFNIITGKKDSPQGVLIRGVEKIFGPGRVTKRLGIDKSFNGEDLCLSKRLFVLDDGFKCRVKKEKRIGIDYALKEDRDKLWRFIIDN